MMRAAKLANSPRLQRVHELLKSGKEYSTKEIMLLADVCAVNSCIAELRANGSEIDCRQSVSLSGKRIWLYKIRAIGAAAA